MQEWQLFYWKLGNEQTARLGMSKFNTLPLPLCSISGGATQPTAVSPWNPTPRSRLNSFVSLWRTDRICEIFGLWNTTVLVHATDCHRLQDERPIEIQDHSLDVRNRLPKLLEHFVEPVGLRSISILQKRFGHIQHRSNAFPRCVGQVKGPRQGRVATSSLRVSLHRSWIQPMRKQHKLD